MLHWSWGTARLPGLAVGHPVALRSTTGENPGVARIVQDFQGLLEVQRNPNQVSLARPRGCGVGTRVLPHGNASQPRRPWPGGGRRRRRSPMRVAPGGRDRNHAIVVVIDQSGGQARLQLAAAPLLSMPPCKRVRSTCSSASLIVPFSPSSSRSLKWLGSYKPSSSRIRVPARRRSPAGDASRWNCGPGVRPPARARSPRTHAHRRDQLLKAFPVPRRRGRLRLVLVDGDYAFGGPAQLDGPRGRAYWRSVLSVFSTTWCNVDCRT